MKYFAKYIPIEGEIKDGDVTINSAGCTARILVTNKKTNNTHKKVQLFLCSRDIIEGDKFWITGYNPLENGGEFDITRSHICTQVTGPAITNLGNKTIWFKSSGVREGEYYVDSSRTYKVIGPISPDATWVREGDEFEEDEIEELNLIYEINTKMW